MCFAFLRSCPTQVYKYWLYLGSKQCNTFYIGILGVLAKTPHERRFIFLKPFSEKMYV